MSGGRQAAPAAGVRDWDAATYDRVSEPQLEWGREVLDRLELTGEETVLDAGCGSGRVTRLLLDRLPRGRVIAVDSAPSMIEQARSALGDERIEFMVADLTGLTLDEPVDAVFSTAVFHWIGDHDLLFRRLHAVLRPGGRLVAQCGGTGNVERFHTIARAVAEQPPFAAFLAGWEGPWNFSSPDQATTSLETAGFTATDCWLERRDIAPPEPREYLRTVCLGHHLEALPESLRGEFVDRVADGMHAEDGWPTEKLNLTARTAGAEPPALDYVRLNLSARRPA